MPDPKNATVFITSYNRIEQQLRALYNFRGGQSFTDIVRQSADKNEAVRRYENDLVEYARLRNAIVHQSVGEAVIAVPCDEVVEKILRIERLICTPPTIGQTLPDKQVTSLDAQISLRRAVQLIAKTGYSNLPVYRGKRMVGIVNNRCLIAALGAVLHSGRSVDAFLSETAVEDVLSESDLFTYYRYLGKNDTLQEVLAAFENNKKLLAVCVSERGKVGERIVNFITPADLPRIGKLLEDYR